MYPRSHSPQPVLKVVVFLCQLASSISRCFITDLEMFHCKISCNSIVSENNMICVFVGPCLSASIYAYGCESLAHRQSRNGENFETDKQADGEIILMQYHDSISMSVM